MAKRQPFDPAKATNSLKGHLGVPSEQRERHSKSGFVTERIAEGRYVSRERAMLTHPGLLAELYNAIVRKHQEAGEPLPERVHIAKMTPSDRATAAHRNILWAYLRISAEVMRGNINIVDYEGMPSPQELERVPLSQTQFDARRFYAWLREQHGFMALTEYLDSVVVQLNPELASDDANAPTKAEIGQSLLGPVNERDAKAAADGALVLACRALSEAARDYMVLVRRYRSDLERLQRRSSLAQ